MNPPDQIDETQHERMLRAERTLLSLTLNLSQEQLNDFLNEHEIDHDEYELILHKHRHVVSRYKEEASKGE